MSHFILSQISPDMAKDLAAWLVCAGAVLFLLNQGAEFLRKIKGKPAHPPNAQLQESHHELARRVDALERAVADTRKELRDEIQSVRETVADLQTNMPNQIVSLLKNTGAI
jgi:hypothetical protein